MATVFQFTDLSNTAGTALTINNSDVLYVDGGVTIGGSQFGVLNGQGNYIFNNGTIFGITSAVRTNTTGSFTVVENLQSGVITGPSYGVSCDNTLYVNNYGMIYGSQGAINFSSSTAFATIYNAGTLGAIVGNNVVSSGTGGFTLQNDGNIIGGVIAIGTANFNSTNGEFNGTFFGSANADTAIGGTVSCGLQGAGGNDLLYANNTQKAADNGAVTTLNGGTGNNALYGGGGYNIFQPGTSAAGNTNQMWGALSRMGGVSGYLNNTVTFSSVFAGVYVDLLNGHNAFVNDNGSTSWDGTGFFQDWITNIPNVIGSDYGDIIQADGTGGTITGRTGADALYGATGRDVFAYTSYNDSNTVNGYDTVVNFERGTDKIDISGFMTANGLSGASLTIFGSGNSSTVYVERTPGTFNSATDLAFIVNSTAGVLTAADFIL